MFNLFIFLYTPVYLFRGSVRWLGSFTQRILCVTTNHGTWISSGKKHSVLWNFLRVTFTTEGGGQVSQIAQRWHKFIFRNFSECKKYMKRKKSPLTLKQRNRTSISRSEVNIVKNPPLFLHQRTFTVLEPRISQW